MAASDGPVALLGIGDPRRWTATDWLADVVPHLVYGVTTHATLAAAIPASESRAARPPVGLLLRAAAIGAATGSRSTAGVAALALTSTPADPGAVVSRLGSRTGTAVSGALARITRAAGRRRRNTRVASPMPGLTRWGSEQP